MLELHEESIVLSELQLRAHSIRLNIFAAAASGVLGQSHVLETRPPKVLKHSEL